MRQSAKIFTIRPGDNKAFQKAVKRLQAELSGDPKDNLITFYLRPKLINGTWHAVPWEDGAAEILVHDVDGPLLPVIQFQDILREDLQGASPNKLNIMGVQALSFLRLRKEIQDRLSSKPKRKNRTDLHYVSDSSTWPVPVIDNYEFHKAVRLLQAQRAQRRDESAPLKFMIGDKVPRHKPSKTKDFRRKNSIPTLPAPGTSATAGLVSEDLAPISPQSLHTTSLPNRTSPPETPLTKRSKIVQDDFDVEIDPSMTGAGPSSLSDRLTNDAENNWQGDTGAFTISLELVDRSVQQPAKDNSAQMREFLIRRFHCSPRPLLHLPFPAVVNKENYRLSIIGDTCLGRTVQR